jgi:hypothetical protein
MNTKVKADAATSAARLNQCPKDNFSFSIMFYPKAMSQPIPHQQPGGLAAGYFGLVSFLDGPSVSSPQLHSLCRRCSPRESGSRS